MRTSLPPVTWLRSFEAAARLGGFAAAGEELGLTPAAVSQQIRGLEARLGFPLFHRRARGVALTDMGRAYLPEVARAFDGIAVATAGLFGVAEAAMLTVRAPFSFSVLRLAPRLPAFRARHPGVALRLATAVWGDALERDRIDVEIRFGDGRWPSVATHRLSEPVSVPVCPPGTDFGTGDVGDAVRTVMALARENAIHIAGCEHFWALFARANGLRETEIATRISADTSIMALEMVAAGLGTAVVAEDLAEAAVAEGRVVAAPGLRLRHEQAHYLVETAAPGARRPEAVLFRDWLLGEIGCD